MVSTVDAPETELMIEMNAINGCFYINVQQLFADDFVKDLLSAEFEQNNIPYSIVDDQPFTLSKM